MLIAMLSGEDIPQAVYWMK